MTQVWSLRSCQVLHINLTKIIKDGGQKKSVCSRLGWRMGKEDKSSSSIAGSPEMMFNAEKSRIAVEPC